MHPNTYARVHAAVDQILRVWTLFIVWVPFVPWINRNSFIAYLREQQHFTRCEDCQSRLEEMIGWYCIDLKPWMNYRTVRAQLHQVWGPVHVEEI